MESSTVLRIVKNVGRQSMRDDITGLSAELSYRMLFAVFPFFIFLAAVGSVVASALDIENPAERIVAELGDALPEDAASVVEGQLQNVMGTQSGGLLSFGVLAALWAAASATNAAIKAMNRAYNVPESRPFYKKYPLAVGITLLFAFSTLGALAVMFGAQIFTEEIAEAVGLGAEASFIVLIVQIPLALALVAMGVTFLYWAGPNLEMSFKWLTPGAGLFVVTWIVATLGFAFYVANFADYNATYGALGGIIILMLWFYITSAALLLGAEFNAVLEEETNAVALEERRRRAREEAGERQPKDDRESGRVVALPGRSPLQVAAERPLTTGFGVVVAGILLSRVYGQR